MSTWAAQCTRPPKWCRLCWDQHWYLQVDQGSLHLWAPLLSRSPWLPQSSPFTRTNGAQMYSQGKKHEPEPSSLECFPGRTISPSHIPKYLRKQSRKLSRRVSSSHFCYFSPLRFSSRIYDHIFSEENSVVLTGEKETTTVRIKSVTLVLKHRSMANSSSLILGQADPGCRAELYTAPQQLRDPHA